MSWTEPEDIRAQLDKEWQRGRLLLAAVGELELFPLRLRLKGPDSRALSERFEAARGWIARLQQGAGSASRPGYRLVMRELRHRVIGSNQVPAEIWVDGLGEALALIGKRRAAERFQALHAATRERLPALLPWLARRPLKALELAEDWERLLDIVQWLQRHPRPGVYLRQVDLPGVHSKLIEQHRGVLAELLDLALPAEAIDAEAAGVAGFARRYGFRDKPGLIRLRMLDPHRPLLPGLLEQDLTVTAASFAVLEPPVRRVFVTENEINFLAFAPLPDAMVIFGAGYGFEALGAADWLRRCELYYWGDIDTHGFVILDQLRARFPDARSLLMDRETLLAHRSYWINEPTPVRRELVRLTAEERALYETLRDDRLGRGVRLEQEAIGFEHLQMILRQLSRPGSGAEVSPRIGLPSEECLKRR